MNRHIEKAKELRSPEKCYNCAETIMMAYADDLGLSETQAECLGCNFGGGMKCGGTCGAITGGLMALGLYGVEDPATITQYYKQFKDAHEGMMNCADLLKANFEKGGAKKPHCDAMVYEAVGYVENILRERHIID